MKRIFCVVFILAALLCLGACGQCSHESWLEATCTESARCADCGITEGEPLGHSPTEPSCTVAGVCTLCGETLAEPLPHSFGPWEIDGEEMSRVCALCEQPETVPTDRELCFAQLLTGHWDYYVDPENISSFWAYCYDGPEFWPCASFDTESGGLLTLPVEGECDALSFYRYDWDAKELKDYELSWRYKGFEVNEAGEDCYSFSIVFPDGTERPGLLLVTEYELLIELKPDGSNALSFFKPLFHERVLGGYWWHLGSLGNGEELIREMGFYFLELRPDRSFFTNMFGEEISGTWHVKPLMDSIGLGHSKPMECGGVFQTAMALWYEKDGRMQSYMEGFVPLEEENYPMENASEGEVRRMMFGYLEHVFRDDVDARGMEALEALPGTWRSETFREARYAESGEKISEEEVESDEFYIEFTEDWHFKAHIDKDYEGRCFLYSVTDNTYSQEDFAYIAIYLMPEEPEPGKEIIRGEMYYYPDGLANAFRVYLQDTYENGKLE